MKKTMKKNTAILTIAAICFMTTGTCSFAAAEDSLPISEGSKTSEAVCLEDAKKLENLDDETRDIILDELNLTESSLTEEERVALLTKGTSSVWNTTYKKEYNVKKSFSMAASLVSTGTKPYTTFTIKNTGTTKIVAVAYEGTIGGSKEMKSVTVAAGESKSFKVTRADILSYGTYHSNGTTVVLSYTVSLYNPNGNAFSCTAKATRYN